MKQIACLLFIILLFSGCGSNAFLPLNQGKIEVPAETKQEDFLSKDKNTLYDTQLSLKVYPEWINLSENHYFSKKIFSPIDHAYNINISNQDFIDSTALEFATIWLEEMTNQYEKTLNSIPDEYREQLIIQQTMWQEYDTNDVFNVIGEEMGYGYIREWHLKRMDRIRDRVIELIQIQWLIDTEVSFFTVKIKNSA